MTANANASKPNSGGNKSPASAKPINKTGLRAKLAEQTGLTPKQVGGVLDSLTAIMIEELNRKNIGLFTLPGVCKFKKKVKPATPERKMISPITKLEITVKAKPARNVVNVRILKGLKDAVA